MGTDVYVTMYVYTVQFTTLMQLLHKMLNQVDADRRRKMMREAPDDAMLQQRRFNTIFILSVL